MTISTPRPSSGGMLSPEELAREVESGRVDTVVVAIADMQGRLQGKRCDARFFLDHVRSDATEACNYLLAVDVEMATVDGYAMSSWERGYGDFVMQPDLGTLRWVPWHPGTVLCHADVLWESRGPVNPAPRQVLRRQTERLAERGWFGYAGTELRVHGLSGHLRAGLVPGLSGADAVDAVQRRLFIVGHGPG